MSLYLRLPRARIHKLGLFTRNISYIRKYIPMETLVEEETLPHYDFSHFYPVKIGDAYQDRYQVIGKLGYGAYFTSWLCRDSQVDRYKVLKVLTPLPNHSTARAGEVRVYEHLSKIESSHLGQGLLHELYDTFKLAGPSGENQCVVLQPMHMTLHEMMKLNPKPFDMPLLKMTVRRVLLALDFLHSKAGVIHTDLKADNLMLSIEDPSMLTDFAIAELQSPSPGKQGYGPLILCGFGQARIGRSHESGPGDIEMPWGCPVDIWNLAGLIWDLFEGEHLFGDISNARDWHDAPIHLAMMVALIGLPPSEFVRHSETAEQCFDSNEDDEPTPNILRETRGKRLSGEEKELFLAFIRSMLKWMPEERYTAKQLLEHPYTCCDCL
ncbi:kinase-like domain-containing protein [Aspergillus germanicus]